MNITFTGNEAIVASDLLRNLNIKNSENIIINSSGVKANDTVLDIIIPDDSMILLMSALSVDLPPMIEILKRWIDEDKFTKFGRLIKFLSAFHNDEMNGDIADIKEVREHIENIASLYVKGVFSDIIDDIIGDDEDEVLEEEEPTPIIRKAASSCEAYCMDN